MGPGVPVGAPCRSPGIAAETAHAKGSRRSTGLAAGRGAGTGRDSRSGCHARSRAKKVPVKNQSVLAVSRRVVASRRMIATAGTSLLLVAGLLLTGATPAAAAPPATVSGQACLPGEGVTVAVDFAPGSDEVRVGCAIGAQASMAAAGAAAGFTFAPTTGFLTTIDTVFVDDKVGYWSVYVNTADGAPNGALTSAWSFATTGIDGGPLAPDTVLLFDLVPDFTATQEDPRITPVELGASATESPAAPTSPSILATPPEPPTPDSSAGSAASGSASDRSSGEIASSPVSSAGASTPASDQDTSSGTTVWLTVAALIALAALGAAAVVIARRRRSAG